MNQDQIIANFEMERRYENLVTAKQLGLDQTLIDLGIAKWHGSIMDYNAALYNPQR